MKKIIFSISLWLAAAAFAATQARDDEDKPPLVFRLGDMAQMQDHTDTYKDFYLIEPDGTTQDVVSVEDMPWSDPDHVWIAGVGGAGLVSNGDTEYSWDSLGNEYVDNDRAFDWPYMLDWTGGGGGEETYYSDGAADATNYNSMNILPDIGDESCAVKEGYPPPASWNVPDGDSSMPGLWQQESATETYQRAAQTMFCVQTGGKAVPLRQNLWQFTGWAAQILNLRAQPPFAGTPTQAVPPTQVALGGLGNLKADGTLWLKLPDGIEEDVTPTVPGLNFYNFNVDGSKYPLYIDLSTSTTNANLETNTPEVCVGQTVTLGADWEGGIPPYTNVDSVRWNLPDKYVNQQTNYSATCTTYVKNQDLLTNLVQQCWYVNLPGGACSVSETLHFSNGQAVNIAAAGGFTVFRPKGSLVVDSPGTPAVEGNNLQLNAVSFDGIVESTDFSGGANWMQLIKRTVISENPAQDLLYSTYGNFWLDNSVFYANSTPESVSLGHNADVKFADNPGIGCTGITRIYDSFKMYLVFKPDGDGIWVTLGRVDWGWKAKAAGAFGGAVLLWSKVTSPIYTDTDEFPVWSSIYNNNGSGD